MDYRPRVDRVKQAAAGRWPEILEAVGGIDAELLDDQFHTCPRCGECNSFKLADVDSGAIECRRCFSDKNCDGVAAVQWLTGCKFMPAIAAIEKYLSIDHDEDSPPSADTAEDAGDESDDDDDDHCVPFETPPKSRKSGATNLVDNALAAGARLWHTPSGVAFATVNVDGHFENLAIRSKPFRHWLARLHYDSTRSAVSAQAATDVTCVLESMAYFDGEEASVHIRVANHDGKIYLDLCDVKWRAIEISPDGWQIVDNPRVRFRRAKAMLPLPVPIQGGSIRELERWFPPGDDTELVYAWLVGAIRGVGPYPVLPVYGEQGSGKSTRARMLRDLIDPNTAPLRAEPREPRDLMIAANNGWVIALDNLSTVPGWQSDALCRLSTGGGFSCRTLYSDDEETIFDATRPIILTGIEEVVTRGDLLDRSIPISLPVIPENERLPESIIWREFNEAKPHILGGLLDAVVAALANEQKVKLAQLPRMADFAIWATAAEPGLGQPAGTFMAAYAGNRASANELALESSPLFEYLRKLLDKQSEWTGTASELLADLEQLATVKDKNMKSWPQAANKLSGLLKRLAPNLRRAGIDVNVGREGKRRYIELRKTADSIVASDTIVATNGIVTESHDASHKRVDGTPLQSDAASSFDDALNRRETEADDDRDANDDQLQAPRIVRVQV